MPINKLGDDNSDNYISSYIVQSELNMVTPEPFPEGRKECQGITLSRQLLPEVTGTNSSQVIQNMANDQAKTAMQQSMFATNDQLNKGSYYDDMAKKKQERQQDLYSSINDNKITIPAANNLNDELPKANLKLVDTAALDYEKNTDIYIKASHELIEMLAGHEDVDLRRAVFITENAYYHNSLDYDKYKKQIDRLVRLCKALIKLHGDSPDNKLACNYAIQALYSDTIPIKGAKSFYPFIYDFNDFFAQKDYSKYFVTKLLNMGMGQCHSLPLLYAILAQQLNTDAYLAYSPMHSYIKFPLDSQLCDFETTCGKPNTDEWIARSGFVSPKALKTGIYLTPTSLRQTIAQCLVELWMEYTNEYGYGRISTEYDLWVLKYFPNCLGAKEEYVNAGIAYCASIAVKYHNPPLTDYSKYPELEEQFNIMMKLQTSMDETGFVRVSRSEYIKWLNTANSEKERRTEKELKNIITSRLENQQQ